MVKYFNVTFFIFLILFTCRASKQHTSKKPPKANNSKDFSVTPLTSFGDLGYQRISDQRLALDVSYKLQLSVAEVELKEYATGSILKPNYTLEWDAFYSDQESFSLVNTGKIKFQKFQEKNDFSRFFTLKGDILKPLNDAKTLLLALKIYTETTHPRELNKAALLSHRMLVKIYTYHIRGKAASFKLPTQKNALTLSAKGIAAQPLFVQKSGLEAEVNLSAAENSKIGDELSYSGFKIEQGLPAATFVNFVMLDPHSSPLSLHGIGIDYNKKILSLEDELEFSLHVKKDEIPFFLIYLGDKYGQFVHIRVNLQPRF